MTMIIGGNGHKPQDNASLITSDDLEPGQPTANFIVDADQTSFMAEAVEASRTQPVLVDFWAPWCGPCKQLTPILEKVVRAAQGRVKLVKVDIEANAELAAQLAQAGLPLQSIPLVAVFYKGQILDVMQGAQRESEVKRFVENVLKSTGAAMPSAELLAAGQQALSDKNGAEAAGFFSSLLEVDPENTEGWAGLIRAMIALDDEEGAAEALSQVPEKLKVNPAIAAAGASLAVYREGKAAAGELETLRLKSAHDPRDKATRFALAGALNGAGEREEAADTLLALIKEDREWNDGAAKAELLRFFEAWGPVDALSLSARRRLSTLLFS